MHDGIEESGSRLPIVDPDQVVFGEDVAVHDPAGFEVLEKFWFVSAQILFIRSPHRIASLPTDHHLPFIDQVIEYLRFPKRQEFSIPSSRYFRQASHTHSTSAHLPVHLI
jgi:hypothetical protein